MKENFQWICQGVGMPDIDVAKVEDWILRVASSHGRIVRSLSYIFCDDSKILEVNRQFLNHDYYTDIITFDYTKGKLLSGDMFISLDTVKTNAELFNAPYLRELHRVIVHGVLHLCGIDDKGPGEREIMESYENKALEMFDSIIADK